MPSMALIAGTMTSRRSQYASYIARTADSSLLSASSAATCAIELGFEVEWLWIFPHAAMIAGCPTADPRRQPVMAKVLDMELTTVTVSGCASNQRMAEVCLFSP